MTECNQETFRFAPHFSRHSDRNFDRGLHRLKDVETILLNVRGRHVGIGGM